jgi:hypothetical protein
VCADATSGTPGTEDRSALPYRYNSGGRQFRFALPDGMSRSSLTVAQGYWGFPIVPSENVEVVATSGYAHRTRHDPVLHMTPLMPSSA